MQLLKPPKSRGRNISHQNVGLLSSKNNTMQTWIEESGTKNFDQQTPEYFGDMNTNRKLIAITPESEEGEERLKIEEQEQRAEVDSSIHIEEFKLNEPYSPNRSDENINQGLQSKDGESKFESPGKEIKNDEA